MKHRVKILSMLLSFVLVLSLLPGMTAWADGTVVTTAGEFLAAVNSGGSMSLANDITLPLDDTFYFEKALIIDLNGHTLTVQGTTAYCMWVILAPVTIRDGAGGGMISHPEDVYTFITHSGGSLTLEGGTLEFTNSDTYGIKPLGGPFTMTGGTIKSAGYSIYRDGQPVTISGGTIIGEFLNSSGDLTITGGSFSFDPSALLPDGYAAPKVGDYWVVGAAAYSVTYAPGDGSGSMNPTKVEKNAEGKFMYKVESCGFTAPDGKTFDFWQGSDEKTYRPGPEVEISGDLTLTAQWKDKPQGGGEKKTSGGSCSFVDLVFNIPGADDSWEYVGGGYVPQRAYRVSLAPMQGGSAALGLTTGDSGTALNVYPTSTVYVFPNAEQGYTLDKIVWSLIDGSASYDITEAKNFVMPAMDAVVYVTFRPVG